MTNDIWPGKIPNPRLFSVALRASFFAKATKDKMEDTANPKEISKGSTYRAGTGILKVFWRLGIGVCDLRAPRARHFFL
jgi:hypothetical protein